MYTVEYVRHTRKVLDKMPQKKAEAIIIGMLRVAKDPFGYDNTISPLQGTPNGYRKRFGDWRVLYTVDTEIRVLEVFKIGSRGDVYK